MTTDDGVDGRATISARVPVGSWPFTGRNADLDLLGETYLDGRYGGVVVLGPAGAGKTRLVEEALALAERSGRRIARAVAHPVASEIPLGALVHLLPSHLVVDVALLRCCSWCPARSS